MKEKVFLIAAIFSCFECFSQTFISKQKAIEDIDYYNKTLQEVHYNPFLFIGKNKYLSEVEKLKDSLKDSVHVNDFIISLYQLSSLKKDGHSSPQITQPKSMSKTRALL